MTASELAKLLGAPNLKHVADFYGWTPAHLRNVLAKNEDAFRALILGYVEVEINDKIQVSDEATVTLSTKDLTKLLSGRSAQYLIRPRTIKSICVELTSQPSSALNATLDTLKAQGCTDTTIKESFHQWLEASRKDS